MQLVFSVFSQWLRVSVVGFGFGCGLAALCKLKLMDTFNPQDLNSVLYPLGLVASHLHEVPDEVVESQLVTYDMLVGLAAVPCRPPAAQLLREAAGRCSDAARRARRTP